MMGNGCDPSQIPVISIQCDWDEVIFSSDEEIWISSKFKGENSVHSKLVIANKVETRLPRCVTGKFSILSLEGKFIEIKFNPTGHVSFFLAASRTLSKIHARNAVSLAVTNAGLGVSVSAGGRFAVWNSSTGGSTTELRGHQGDVYKCRFFPSGLVVLSAGADMTLKIWCAETGQCAATLVGHLGPVNDFCIVDRGRNVISVSKDGTAKLWDCGKSACLSTIFLASHAFNCCALRNLPESSPDGARKEQCDDREVGTKNKLLIIGSEEGLLYGIAVFSRKKLFSVVVGSAVNVVLVLGDKIVAGCQSGAIKIYSYCEGKGTAAERTFDESSSPVLCGSSYKDKGFFIGRGDGTVTYYDCLYFCNKRIYLTGPNIDTISDICLTDDKLYTCCRDGKIREYLISETMSRFYGGP